MYLTYRTASDPLVDLGIGLFSYFEWGQGTACWMSTFSAQLSHPSHNMALFIKTSMLALLTARANALTIQSAVFLGNVTSTPNDQAVRDNGYSGNVGTAIIDTFDDSSQCDNAYDQTNCGYPNYYTYTNSAGVGKSPTSFQDEPSSSAPNYFCGYTYGEDAPTNALGELSHTPYVKGEIELMTCCVRAQAFRMSCPPALRAVSSIRSRTAGTCRAATRL